MDATGTIVFVPSSIFRPLTGAKLISLCNPFFARSVVASSRRAPRDIMKATSPAANISPIAIAAIIAIVIKSADEILLMPTLTMMRRIDKYTKGIPHTITATQEGAKGNILSPPI